MMIKKIFLFCILASSITLFSNYDIYVENKKDCFELHIVSTDMRAYCSYLKPTSIYIEDADGERGQIFLDIEPDENIEPIGEMGYNQACIEFSKGICLPKINMGEYDLFISGLLAGRIFVEREDVYFISYDYY